MCKKPLTVAIIDSGIDIESNFLKGKDIKSIKFNNGKIEETYDYNSYHGTKVCMGIYKECEDIKVKSITILDENNRCRLDELINSIIYCIDNDIDIINLSLGICTESKMISELEEVCNKAIEKGIVIFSADNNHGELAYPSNFKNVIGIGYNKNILDKNYEVDKEKRKITFSTVNLDIAKETYKYYNRGNSFLVPYVVGIFCRYIKHFKLKTRKNIQDEFLIFMENLEKEYRYKIFNMIDIDTFEKEAIFYPFNKMNEKIVSDYTDKFNLMGIHKLKELDYEINSTLNKLNTYNHMSDYIDYCDLAIIGEITNKESEYKKQLNQFMLYAKEHKLDLLIRHGYVSTFSRYLFSKNTGNKINCQYL